MANGYNDQYQNPNYNYYSYQNGGPIPDYLSYQNTMRGYENYIPQQYAAQQPDSFWQGMQNFGSQAANVIGGVGSVAQGIGAVGNLASSIYGMIQGPPEPVKVDNFDQWVKTMPDRMSMVQNIMPMPYMEGVRIPEFKDIYYSDKPSELTQSVYNQFLGRKYGSSPEELNQKRDLILSALTPTETELGMSPAGFQGELSPVGAADALTQLQNVLWQDQQGYLKNAAIVAAYNASRARNLAGIIG